jgi:hypothetical protein
VARSAQHPPHRSVVTVCEVAFENRDGAWQRSHRTARATPMRERPSQVPRQRAIRAWAQTINNDRCCRSG